ncbi:MAG TPA: hypothetical protein PKX10_11015 [Propioniciclava tarda]|nr:hypothetical protein [Propioniciclava tarda]HQA31926.1 hypothetical protein [Propioniciclava tarda]HQD61124.1 hypothetical protein [Propioniciclava tarda]
MSALPSRPVLPASGVTFDVVCPEPAGGRPHEVTITPDWRLLHPHDLDAERVGVALGGQCLCVALADHALPAVRGYLAHRLRLDVAQVAHAVDRSWQIGARVRRCCDEPGFPTVRDAAAHLRRPRHWALRFGASTALVTAVAQRILDALAAADPTVGLDQAIDQRCPASDVSEFLVEPYGLSMLWDAGVHPCLLPELVGSDGPLSVKDVLARAYALVENAPYMSGARITGTWPQWGIASAGHTIEQTAELLDPAHGELPPLR